MSNNFEINVFSKKYKMSTCITFYKHCICKKLIFTTKQMNCNSHSIITSFNHINTNYYSYHNLYLVYQTYTYMSNETFIGAPINKLKTYMYRTVYAFLSCIWKKLIIIIKIKQFRHEFSKKSLNILSLIQIINRL